MPTVPEILRQNALREPGREALVGSGHRWTWAQVDADVDRRTAALQARGVRRGDRCAIMAANSPEHVLTFYAALRAGAIAVPVNARLAAPEVVHVLRDSGSTTLVADAAHLGVAQRAADASATPVLALEDLGLGTGAPPEPVALGEEDDAVILYTSGTTGEAKGVLHDHHRLLWTGLSQLPVCGFGDAERYLHIAPLYHGSGITFITAMTVVAGCQVVLPAFDPPRVLDAMEQERITAFLGVPTMVQMLLRLPDLTRRDLHAWRVLVFGAAPMPPSVIRTLDEVLPQVQLIQQCGQTEAGPNGIYADDGDTRLRPEASGRKAMPFLTARVVGEDGQVVPPGGVGELVFRGTTVMKGYWGRPEATAEVLRDGWLHTGDLVRLDPDGFMTVVDRMKDMILTGGRNVYCVEVEQALAQHPDVQDCAVLGRADDTWGESIIAVVTPREGTTVSTAQLRDHARALIADYKLPHHVVIAPVPRNAAGKVLKRELRALLA